jgi:hypothetical protein
MTGACKVSEGSCDFAYNKECMNILQEVLDWSEVWAPLMPLVLWAKFPKQPKHFWPIILYLCLALVIDLVIDIGWKFKSQVPAWLKDNNFLYNIHSIVRFACFSSFFILLNQPFQQKLKKAIPYLAFLFLVVNFFVFKENFLERDSFSSRLLATEAGLLLAYCLLYFLYRFQDDSLQFKRTAEFSIVLGLSIYVVLNFFYFLFYKTLIKNGYAKTVEWMWDIHNATFIILCLFIAHAFYVSGNKRY